MYDFRWMICGETIAESSCSQYGINDNAGRKDKVSAIKVQITDFAKNLLMSEY
jgi:hypothetical protein